MNVANGNTKTLSHKPDAVSDVIGTCEILHPDNNPTAKTNVYVRPNFFFK